MALRQMLWQYGRCVIAIRQLLWQYVRRGGTKTDVVAIWKMCDSNKTAVVAICETWWH